LPWRWQLVLSIDANHAGAKSRAFRVPSETENSDAPDHPGTALSSLSHHTVAPGVTAETMHAVTGCALTGAFDPQRITGNLRATIDVCTVSLKPNDGRPESRILII